MTTPLSNSEIRDAILTEFKQVLKLAPADYTENCTNVVMSLIEQVCNESRIDELKQLWNYTQSDIVPEGAKPNDMGDRLHERIKTLTKESES